MLIDGLQCGHFSGEVFSQLRAGGLGCVTVTCGFWESAIETMDIVARWHELERAHADLVGIAYSAADIERIAGGGRTAIILGSQNSELLSGRIAFVELFASMGLRVMQLTYNTQNALGSSCYEPNDSGLTKFGTEVVSEMNRAGILIDLSHVGDVTALNAIERSIVPVAITHANPSSLFPHKRNKPDNVLKALARHGGVLGCATYRNITGDQFCSSAKAWGEMVARTVDLIGIDHVAVGTDRSHGHKKEDYLWMRQGRWTRTSGYGASATMIPEPARPPDFFKKVEDIASIPHGLREAGFSVDEVDKISHRNWLRIYGAVFPKHVGPVGSRSVIGANVT